VESTPAAKALDSAVPVRRLSEVPSRGSTPGEGLHDASGRSLSSLTGARGKWANYGGWGEKSLGLELGARLRFVNSPALGSELRRLPPGASGC
jgi:hypothetical protein